MTKRDLKLQGCAKAFEGVADKLSLANSDLHHVADAYRRNLARIRNLIQFPGEAIAFTFRSNMAVAQVKSKNPDIFGQDAIDAVNEQIRNEVNRLRSSPQDVQQRFKFSLDFFVMTILEATGQADPSGLEAWLGAQITLSWTAFEALTGDLWEAAVNCKPSILSKISRKKLNAADVKKIDINLLEKYNFDISRHMGTLLIESNKYSFDKLSEIRRAYEDIFGEELNFLIEDRRLDALSVIRNNLVHSAGIIDRKYASRANVLPPEAAGELGGSVPLDGELVAHLINPVLKLGNELLLSVDAWLTSH